MTHRSASVSPPAPCPGIGGPPWVVSGVDFGDLMVLLWAAVCLFVPGTGLLLALPGIPRVAAVAGAPGVTLGILYVAALLGGATTLPYGLASVLAVWLLLLGVCLALRRFLPGQPSPAPPASGERTGPRLSPVQAVGAGATALATVLGVVIWVRGMGGLGAIPQEHDTIVHSELVAHVLRTGQAAPWQSFPGDLVSGQPTGFYPNGFHLYAALVGSLGANPVLALNAAMVVLFSLALSVGVAGLGLRLRPPHLAPLAAGSAALVAAVSYHPISILMHDGGILPNAASFALMPGAVALLLVAGRRGWTGVLPVALLVAGLVALHPTSAVTVGLTAGAWLLTTAATFPTARRRLPRDLGVLAVGAAAGAALLIPFVLAAAGVTTVSVNVLPGVVGVGRNVIHVSVWRSLGLTVTAPYGGYLDPHFHSTQTWITALSLGGLAGCLLLRRNAAVVVAFLVWAAFLFAFLADLPLSPLRALSGLYYNSYSRISGGVAVVQWLAAGLAVAGITELLTRAVHRVRAAPPVRVLRPVLAATAVLALVLVVCLPYANRDVEVAALRYRNPAYNRVDAFDLRAAAFVAHRIHPGERVMNNANDGSTFGYVFYGLRIVVTQSIGSRAAPYMAQLLGGFNRLGEDPVIRDTVCRLRITWAIVDDDAPRVGVRGLFWAPGGGFTVPTGLLHLEGVPGVIPAARFGHVAVYRVDPVALGCADARAK
jgi:hypothetical protein